MHQLPPLPYDDPNGILTDFRQHILEKVCTQILSIDKDICFSDQNSDRKYSRILDEFHCNSNKNSYEMFMTFLCSLSFWIGKSRRHLNSYKILIRILNTLPYKFKLTLNSYVPSEFCLNSKIIRMTFFSMKRNMLVKIDDNSISALFLQNS